MIWIWILLDITYNWYVNEQLTIEGSDTLPSGHSRGTEIRIEAFANDGRVDSEPFEFSFVISNTPPTSPHIDITPIHPQPKENQDNLYCTIVLESSDIDNDDLEYSVSWYKMDKCGREMFKTTWDLGTLFPNTIFHFKMNGTVKSGHLMGLIIVKQPTPRQYWSIKIKVF